MIRASIEWHWNHHFLYALETGEALLFSSPSYEGDSSWQFFFSYQDARIAAGAAPSDDTRDKGETEFSEDFIERVRSAPGGKLLPCKGDEGYREEGYPGQEAYQEST